ncbi:hypothetical protein [Glycomyces artemisiae]|uniref:Uncharacterized protein n=1 Tax=Glycomyces artemisiae TaxID=1076443 RepID=A0A2T0UH92_9ACTN|nr:hypothetical protein [Glycomyces artemisiae]PRY57197.1 hypothetical protein B0I28_10743 [Glycomyces artemisiae]
MAEVPVGVAAVDGQYSLTWDFGEGRGIALDRKDFLARQDDQGMWRMVDQVIEGSNDLQNWTTLTDPTDLTQYTRGSRILCPREVAAVREAREEAGADEAALARRLIRAWDLLDPLVTEKPATLDPAWVAASTATADGATSAAANGWRMFDGNTGTWTDTTTKSCTNTVLPTDGTAFTIVGIRYFPRDNAISRLTGLAIDGSNDSGATWTKFASTGTPVRGWNTVSLTEPVSFDALRISGGNGYCNVAELQFIVQAIDKSGSLSTWSTLPRSLRPAGPPTPGPRCSPPATQRPQSTTTTAPPRRRWTPPLTISAKRSPV